MSYKMNKIGPWPIIDVASAKYVQATAATTTAVNAPIRPYLTTANLGSQSEAYLNMLINLNQSVPTFARASYGIILKPSELVGNIVLDVSGYVSHSQETDFLRHFVVGYLDGSTPTAGFSANNDVTDFHVIPDSISGKHDFSSTICTQIILKSIVSSELSSTDYLFVGWSLFNNSAATASTSYVDMTISARYSFAALNTSYGGI